MAPKLNRDVRPRVEPSHSLQWFLDNIERKRPHTLATHLTAADCQQGLGSPGICPGSEPFGDDMMAWLDSDMDLRPCNPFANLVSSRGRQSHTTETCQRGGSSVDTCPGNGPNGNSNSGSCSSGTDSGGFGSNDKGDTGLEVGTQGGNDGADATDASSSASQDLPAGAKAGRTRGPRRRGKRPRKRGKRVAKKAAAQRGYQDAGDAWILWQSHSSQN